MLTYVEEPESLDTGPSWFTVFFSSVSVAGPACSSRCFISTFFLLDVVVGLTSC